MPPVAVKAPFPADMTENVIARARGQLTNSARLADPAGIALRESTRELVELATQQAERIALLERRSTRPLCGYCPNDALPGVMLRGHPVCGTCAEDWVEGGAPEAPSDTPDVAEFEDDRAAQRLRRGNV